MSEPTGPGAGVELIGRDAETERIDTVIAQLHQGGGALVVSGEPGIGKSALLADARARAEAAGARVLETVGVESEAELAFAGLHQLLLPLDLSRDVLPGPQRDALAAAFGFVGEAEPDLFHVALAVFRLVCEAADSGPLVLILDDAQWLDRSTLDVLTFVARRLGHEPVALLAGVRDGYATPLDAGRLPSLVVGRLSASAADALIRRSAPDLHPIMRARVLAEAAGNPLAIVELARALPLSPPASDPLSPPPTLTARLERAFAARLDELPQDTLLTLLAAALDGRASLAEVLACAAAVQRSAVGVAALDPAVDAGLVEVLGTEVRFRHPLVRSAVRQAALPAQVMSMYEALSAAVADPERRLWHSAMSTVGHDEPLAAALEDHARLARRRGAAMAAAAALERAASLTADPRVKGERLIRAAEVAYELGRVDVVRGLIVQAEPLEVGATEQARLTWLRQMVTGDVWTEAGAAKTFVAIAQRLRDGGDPDMALRSLVPVAHRCWWTRSRTRTREYVVETAQSVGVSDHDARLLVVLALAHPEAMGPSILERVGRLRLADVPEPEDAMSVGIAVEKAGDAAAGAKFLGRAVEGLREQGRLGILTQALVHYAWAATHAGDWGTAVAAATEGAGLAVETRQPQFGITGELVAALATALRGNETEAEAMVGGPERTVLAMRGGPLLAPAHLARGAAALGDGRHEDAFRHLWRVFDEDDPAFHRFMRRPAVLDLVEAAAGSGQTHRITVAVAELDHIAARSAPPILCAGLACARPVMADDTEAEALFAAALADPLVVAHVFLHARTLFSYGRWLRRQRRSVDSREPLRTAIELFGALGASRWTRRVRQELRATGETIGRRTPDARDRLTAQELQIAQLAARGLSNREIGERLFLSHRTIGSHLYRIFPKLGITARVQLRDVLVMAADDARSTAVG